MRRITYRFVLLIASAAIAPLLLYGIISIRNLQQGTESTVREGNRRLANQVSEEIFQYMEHNTRVLRTVGLVLRGTHMEPWQQTKVLTDFSQDFPEFREITFFGNGGRVVATSRVDQTSLSLPAAAGTSTNDVSIAPLDLDEDNLPRTTIAIRISQSGQEPGWIVGEIALFSIWNTVDRVRVGTQGYALLIADELRLIAHGDPRKKKDVVNPGPLKTAEQNFAAQILGEPNNDTRSTQKITDGDGREMLVAGAAVSKLPWVVVVEQPTAEAFAQAIRLQGQLYIAIGLALLGTVILGYLWGRSFIRPILALTRATQAIAAGRMDQRVAIGGKDEFRQLGDAFNSMADRLVQLQEDVRRQERQAMFGKIAAGLVHDLSHPIQTIVTNSKLIVRMFDDAEYRDTFKRMIERESLVIKRVLEDLRNIAQPLPLEHFPVDIDRSVADVIESMKVPAETAGVNLRSELSSGGALVQGDVFALGRVYRNLVINAIQATAPGGDVSISTEATPERVRVRVSDTGCGIPPDRLAAIFDDFVTTKRRGLGLGLAISKKIVEQLGGQISVTSEVGKGTTFVLEFPRAKARPIALVAG